MPAPSLTVAVAQPATVPHDLVANVRAHVAAVRTAAVVVGARLLVLPEMSLTGYELDADAVDPGHPVLDPLVDACRATGVVALAGAPVREGGLEHLAVLLVDGTGTRVAYRKTFLGEDEAERFSPGDGARVVAVDGWAVGLAICKDTGEPRHTARLAEAGVDLYAAGVVDAPDEEDVRRARTLAVAAALRVPVAVASAAGPATTYPLTRGGSTVHAADGRLLARAGRRPGEVVGATLVRPVRPVRP
ncbi:(R)-stereoselective amidase [Nocardioides aquaticus]|uniref:(R)-stereoselective amidase n=2 Tax=Nocardioides aquaticus TaxID=160826 RepID=A0ABX8EP53_9ACTN|nr:carbon-nitrogen hydrolase family protein [Nocardioides aquaticus]QVT81982.1 (R)-stereoselective amidase [Nocardioides aquaticus]